MASQPRYVPSQGQQGGGVLSSGALDGIGIACRSAMISGVTCPVAQRHLKVASGIGTLVMVRGSRAQPAVKTKHQWLRCGGRSGYCRFLNMLYYIRLWP